jgi:hypothetical protein
VVGRDSVAVEEYGLSDGELVISCVVRKGYVVNEEYSFSDGVTIAFKFVFSYIKRII